jgi:hypothetical protein
MSKIIPFFLMMVIFGCDSKTTDTEALSKIYVHELIAREESGKNFNSYKQKFDEILTENGYTEDTYRAKLEELSADRENWEIFFNISLDYLNELKTKADSLKK